MKKIIVIVIGLLFLSGCGQKEFVGEKETFEGITYQETNKKTDNVMMYIDNGRKILVELYPDIAPISVSNFKKLVENDFYNEVIFHRVIKDFVIQAGDGTLTGKRASNIKGEFKENGVKNDLSHTRGILSMARNSISMDSANSQFFIMHQDNTSLDGKYAAFGKVIAGMDVVDEIASVVTDSNDKPIKDIKIERMEFVKIGGNNE